MAVSIQNPTGEDLVFKVMDFMDRDQCCFYKDADAVVDELLQAMFSQLEVHAQPLKGGDLRDLWALEIKKAGGKLRNRAKTWRARELQPDVEQFFVPGTARDLVDRILKNCDRAMIVATGDLPQLYRVDGLLKIGTHHAHTVAEAEADARVLLIRAISEQRVHRRDGTQRCYMPSSHVNDATLFDVERSLERVYYWSEIVEVRKDCARALNLVKKMRRRSTST